MICCSFVRSLTGSSCCLREQLYRRALAVELNRSRRKRHSSSCRRTAVHLSKDASDAEVILFAQKCIALNERSARERLPSSRSHLIESGHDLFDVSSTHLFVEPFSCPTIGRDHHVDVIAVLLRTDDRTDENRDEHTLRKSIQVRLADEH